MTNEELYKAIGDINENYVKGAKNTMKAKIFFNYKVLGAIAACACIALIGITTIGKFRTSGPNPDYVQVVSPIMEVQSEKEMEEYLDFDVPVIDKEVGTYIVLVIDGYPKTARIMYADGSIFNMEYGTGDISGICGGTVEKEETINGVKVSFCRYEGLNGEEKYAIWENGGFTYSLSGADSLKDEVQSLIK